MDVLVGGHKDANNFMVPLEQLVTAFLTPAVLHAEHIQIAAIIAIIATGTMARLERFVKHWLAGQVVERFIMVIG